jgi:ankyrin repeat protein
MKHLLLTTIAAVVLVGCGESKPPVSIHEAAETGNIEAVKQHLAAGADVEVKGGVKGGFFKGTPLHFAAWEGHKKIVELLIDKGAGVNAMAENGGTPLDWAIFTNKTKITDLLRKHGGKTGDWLNADKSIHKAARAGHIEAVKQHIASGTDVNAKSEDGQTSLHFATIGGHKEIAELLIAASADMNAQDEKGNTPLHFAVVFVHKEIVELLIARGANVNAKNDKGWTPLRFGANINDSDEVVDLLKQHGAKYDY